MGLGVLTHCVSMCANQVAFPPIDLSRNKLELMFNTTISTPEPLIVEVGIFLFNIGNYVCMHALALHSAYIAQYQTHIKFVPNNLARTLKLFVCVCVNMKY